MYVVDMQYSEMLARRIVADVAKITTDRSIVWVQLEHVAQRLEVSLSSVETAANAAMSWGWLGADASFPQSVRLTEAGRALVRRLGL
jgi:hypothetical protein